MDLTRGSVFRNLIQFAWPYLLACFLQTFYGVADLLIAGLYNGATVTSAISIGSQLMHMITLLLAGFAMAVTVLTGQAFGAGDHGKFRQVAGNAIVGFTWLALISCLVALPMTSPLLSILQPPPGSLRRRARLHADMFFRHSTDCGIQCDQRDFSRRG